MTDPTTFVLSLLGFIFGVLILYFLIRLAVRHGIQDVRKLDALESDDQP